MIIMAGILATTPHMFQTAYSTFIDKAASTWAGVGLFALFVIIYLMKKYKYTMKNESDENKIKNNKSNNSLRKYNNKKILSPITNKNVSFLTNTKLKHQKIQSYYNKEKNVKSTSIKFIKSK